MRNRTLVCQFLCAALLNCVAVGAYAQEVTLPHKSLTLNANLEIATGKQLADGAILITHGGFAHHGMETIGYLQSLLKDKGYSSLAISLSLGIDNRHGMFDCKMPLRHGNDEAVEEIGVWLQWLKKQGATRVTLLGHSRGGAQTARYAAEGGDASVNAVVLMAPATIENTSAATYQRNFKQSLEPVVDTAQQLERSGHGDTVMAHTNILTCVDTPATAAAFLSYYGPQARVDTRDQIPKITKPTLVVVAGADEVVIGLDKIIAPLVNGASVQMKVIDGSDHLFRDLNADDAVDAIAKFLGGI